MVMAQEAWKREEPKFLATLQMIQRCGITETQVRWSGGDDDEDVLPVVWIVVALRDEGWAVGAGHSPLDAAEACAEKLIDGGQCAHCNKPSSFDANPQAGMLVATEDLICWYRWDPERATYRRTCEGKA